MRFPVVLFDLDGTLIDSGGMILASFRHATRTVLAREFSDEALLAHVAPNRPHPDGILRALELLDARPDEAAYVGDSPFDVEAAKRAGVYAVAVGWGGIHTRERLEAAEPDAFVERAEELVGRL